VLAALRHAVRIVAVVMLMLWGCTPESNFERRNYFVERILWAQLVATARQFGRRATSVTSEGELVSSKTRS
jgi:predicted membrane chloride channel (bestrophin family)